MPIISDLRIASTREIVSPRELFTEIPSSESERQTVLGGRNLIQSIMSGEDSRMLAIVGPCSIHDTEAAKEYAKKLAALSEKIKDRIVLVMRVYFEKPRTRLGWKGLILDPAMDGSNDIQKGLRVARTLLRDVASAGIPSGSEALDPIVPQYLDDLLSWVAIGARTTESQTHREMASGLSMPVGFKNGTDGSIETAVNAMASAFAAHSFIGIDKDGRTCILDTTGNDQGHIILRGGKDGPNYYREKVEETERLLGQAGLPPRVLVDCSHSNSNKDFHKQRWVLEEVISHRERGYKSVKGFMLESNLFEGRQDIPPRKQDLRYGVSVTDPCIGWDETQDLLLSAHARLSRIGS